MPFPLRCGVFLAAAAVLGGALSGCGSVDSASRRVASMVTPYRIEVVQGNVVTREQVGALQPGMSRLQVREILGTPLLTSVFHKDRWDYVFTIKRPGIEPQERRLAVFFRDEALERFEGDEMPTEAEFVATLDRRGRTLGKVPRLEATDAELARYPGRAVPPPAAVLPDAPLPLDFPPLEPGAPLR